jgi:endoglycosylceramidase
MLRRRIVLGLAAVLAATAAVPAVGLRPSTAAPAPAPAYQVSYPFVHDSAGRVVFFHGMNVVYKVPPYYPPANVFGSSDADFLAAHGFDIVRLGVIWAGLEPSPGHFDDTYLDNIAQIVSLLQSRGIAVLLDFHQDMMNELFQGEGFPRWAVHTEPPPTNCCGFPGNYFTPAVMRAFDNVWLNRFGLWDAYRDAWTHVAARFAHTGNVIGYDLFNEPWPGTQWESCGSPAGCPVFDTQLMQRFFEHVIAGIRSVDTTHIVWWEPNVTDDFGAGNGVGLLSPIHDSAADDGISFHDYCLVGGLVPGVTRAMDPECPTAEQLTIQQQQPAAAARNRAALLLSEFGASDDLTDIGRVAALADGAMVSWTFWQYKAFSDPTGNPGEEGLFDAAGNVKPKVALLERTYPTAVAGTPLAFSFDPSTKVFTFRYTADPGIALPTEIFVPVVDQYGGAYSVAVSGPATVVSAAGASRLQLESTGPGTVTVTVTR